MSRGHISGSPEGEAEVRRIAEELKRRDEDRRKSDEDQPSPRKED